MDQDQTLESTAERKPRKATWIALLIPCTLLTGLLGGMLVGARFVPSDAGLAGGATVLFYGIAGMLLGLMMTVVFARRLSAQSIKTVSLGSLVVFVAVLSLVVWQFVARQREVEQRSRIASPTR